MLRDWNTLFSVVKLCTYSTTGGTKNNCCFINWEFVININILYLISGSAYRKLSWTVDYRAIFLYSSQTVRTLDYTHVKQTTYLVILNRPLCWLYKVLFIGNRLLWVEAGVKYLTVTCVILYRLDWLIDLWLGLRLYSPDAPRP